MTNDCCEVSLPKVSCEDLMFGCDSEERNELVQRELDICYHEGLRRLKLENSYPVHYNSSWCADCNPNMSPFHGLPNTQSQEVRCSHYIFIPIVKFPQSPLMSISTTVVPAPTVLPAQRTSVDNSNCAEPRILSENENNTQRDDLNFLMDDIPVIPLLQRSD